MSVTSTLISTAVGGLILFVGLVAGYQILGSMWLKKSYTPANGVELLQRDRPEVWNELRALNPNWMPNLSRRDFSSRNLQFVNLSGARLDHSNFTKANLEGADFSASFLNGADFTDADLRRAVFDDADLTYANLQDANLAGASFRQTRLNGAKIDREQLYAEQLKAGPVDRKILPFIIERPELLDELNPQRFEQLVAVVMDDIGYEIMSAGQERVKGFDFLVRSRSSYDTLVVECKAYANNRVVGVAPLRALYAAKLSVMAQGAFLGTSGRFTGDAVSFSEEYGDIRLVGRDELMRWITLAVDRRPHQ